MFALARRLWLVFHTVTMEMEPKGILYITDTFLGQGSSSFTINLFGAV